MCCREKNPRKFRRGTRGQICVFGLSWANDRRFLDGCALSVMWERSKYIKMCRVDQNIFYCSTAEKTL